MAVVRQGLMWIALLVTALHLAGPESSQDRSGVESWADRRLGVTQGLMLWLDASTVGASRQASRLPPLREGDKLDTWLDGSGRGQQVAQQNTGAQPRYWVPGDLKLVRFD